MKSESVKTGYYASLDGTMDAEDIIEKFGYVNNWFRANIIKYAIRAGRKSSDTLEKDLTKLIDYALREIEHFNNKKSDTNGLKELAKYEQQ